MSTPPPTSGSDPNALLTEIIRKLEEAREELQDLRHDIRGNGGMGLMQRMGRAESFLFQNPKTGDPGMVQDVRTMKELVVGIRAQLRLLNWFLGVFGTTGLAGAVIWVLRVVFGPV